MVELTILGCGSSPGVPIIGCQCEVCRSDDPRNRRSRASVLFQAEGKNILVDTSPDLRAQALREGFSHVDAIIFTHDHADHTHGIDDVKAFNRMARTVIPAYMEAEGMASITRRFEYAFKPPPPDFGWFRPALTAVEVPINSTVNVAGVDVRFFPQVHGRIRSMGVRIGNIAYSTDCNYLPEEAFAALEGVEIWVVDCLRHAQAPTHAHLPLSLEWIARVKPRLAVLTHLAHEMEYSDLSAQLPEGVVVAVDGMRL